MVIIFGTTNERKIEDLRNVVKGFNLDLDIRSLTDIGWDLGDILENGSTL